MRLITERYLDQVRRWPQAGRQILAQFDRESIVVYQAYRPATARYAVLHQQFGGEWSFTRMSWIKPNFLWMMFRSGWGSKANQETTLAIRLQRTGFDLLLAEAVPSSFDPRLYASEQDWQMAIADSEVRLQWDPDHDPAGAKLERRAIQLGLRGETLRRYASEWIIEIEDLEEFVAEQREQLRPGYLQLVTPREEPYPVADLSIRYKLGLEG